MKFGLTREQRELEERAAEFANETFGKAIAEHQAIALKMADVQTEIKATRLLTPEAAWMKDRGERVTEAGARVKLFALEAANEVAYDALQTLGGYGYMRDESPVERHYRDARVTGIYEGTARSRSSSSRAASSGL